MACDSNIAKIRDFQGANAARLTSQGIKEIKKGKRLKLLKKN